MPAAAAAAARTSCKAWPHLGHCLRHVRHDGCDVELCCVAQQAERQRQQATHGSLQDGTAAATTARSAAVCWGLAREEDSKLLLCAPSVLRLTGYSASQHATGLHVGAVVYDCVVSAI
jgi:hypothetical protein